MEDGRNQLPHPSASLRAGFLARNGAPGQPRKSSRGIQTPILAALERPGLRKPRRPGQPQLESLRQRAGQPARRGFIGSVAVEFKRPYWRHWKGPAFENREDRGSLRMCTLGNWPAKKSRPPYSFRFIVTFQ